MFTGETMNNKLQLSNNKTLKLSNVLMMEIDIGEESNNDINKQILKMENYIKSKGAANRPIDSKN